MDEEELPEGYKKSFNDGTKLIEELVTEDSKPINFRSEFDKELNRMEMEKNGTIISKTRFINEIQDGLGDEIRNGLNNETIKTPWYNKLLKFMSDVTKKI